MNPDSKPICPCCGQDILIPNELTSIGLRDAPLRVLFTLYRARPNLVAYTGFQVGEVGLKTYVSMIREALRDTGSNWYIENTHGQGYKLLERKQKQEKAA